MDLNRLHNIFFLGIGGIGMSALARYFHARGIEVSGYDRTPSPITQALQNEGIQVWFDDKESILPEQIDLAVYTPAVPKSTILFAALSAKSVPLMKRAELLGLISGQLPTIAIAGTHGKTTISTMVAHILKTAGIKTTAFLGGISTNYQTNFLDDEQPEWMVVEADEFDRSFLNLRPDIALISAIDADHLDIYGTELALRASFDDFVKRIKPAGTLVLKKGLSAARAFSGRTLTYHTQQEADFMAKNVEVKEGCYLAAIDGLLKTSQFALGLPGRHNLENALGAAAIAWTLGVDASQITTALSTFRGVKRRFETCYQDEKTVFIDDYAHHPEEIRACVKAVRELYPGRQITAIFQPHLFSRTRDLAEQFAQTLALTDRLLLLDIYPARELPIEGVTSQMLLEKIDMSEKKFINKEDIFYELEKNPPEVLLTMGAGDIDRLVPEIALFLKDKRL
ncbi:MAG: UDP-N-acetylmuramate--L-alanine ligase [Bacteroidales bacterium]|nr:UDP-N-acetylmuramate--L-alanine ligase [Bacteroidales bacterium]